jgi:hypothetical protein
MTKVEIDGALSQANVRAVTGNYYSELGPTPLLGRLITPDDVNHGSNALKIAAAINENKAVRLTEAIFMVSGCCSRAATAMKLTSRPFPSTSGKGRRRTKVESARLWTITSRASAAKLFTFSVRLLRVTSLSLRAFGPRKAHESIFGMEPASVNSFGCNTDCSSRTCFPTLVRSGAVGGETRLRRAQHPLHLPEEPVSTDYSMAVATRNPRRYGCRIRP